MFVFTVIYTCTYLEFFGQGRYFGLKREEIRKRTSWKPDEMVPSPKWFSERKQTRSNSSPWIEAATDCIGLQIKRRTFIRRFSTVVIRRYWRVHSEPLPNTCSHSFSNRFSCTQSDSPMSTRLPWTEVAYSGRTKLNSKLKRAIPKWTHVFDAIPLVTNPNSVRGNLGRISSFTEERRKQQKR